MKIVLDVQPAPAGKPDGFETLMAEGTSARTEFAVFSDIGGPNLKDPSQQDQAGLLLIVAGKKYFVAVKEIAAQLIKGHQHASVNNAPGCNLESETRINF